MHDAGDRVVRIVGLVPALEAEIGQVGARLGHDHDAVTHIAQSSGRIGRERPSGERRARLRAAHPATEPAREHDADECVAEMAAVGVAHRTTRTLAAPRLKLRLNACARRLPSRRSVTRTRALPFRLVRNEWPAKRIRTPLIAKRPECTLKRNVVGRPRFTRFGLTARRSLDTPAFTPATLTVEAQSATLAPVFVTVSFTVFAPLHACSSSTCDRAADTTPAPSARTE